MGIVIQDMKIQGRKNIRHSKRAGGMPGTGFNQHIYHVLPDLAGHPFQKPYFVFV
jgi:hypothetical protein